MNYDELYKIIRPRLKHERSLEFIATGPKVAGQDRNTGCDIVKRLVGELAKSGNSSVFGLIDWDGHHEPSDRIIVLGHNRRNGLENVIFDPLLIAALIHRDGQGELRRIGASTAYVQFLAMETNRLQEMASRVAECVLRSKPPRVANYEYLGGFSLELDERYFTTDDHILESMILAAFPALNSVARGRAGKMMHHIITTILNDRPEFIPVEVVEAFREILEAPAHFDDAQEVAGRM
jgi:hypothetical protein